VQQRGREGREGKGREKRKELCQAMLDVIHLGKRRRGTGKGRRREEGREGWEGWKGGKEGRKGGREEGRKGGREGRKGSLKNAPPSPFLSPS